MRTDRVRLCPACALRLPRLDACPVCGATRLTDLTGAAGRRRALALLRRRRRPVVYRRLANALEHALTGYVRYGVGIICALGALISLVQFKSFGAAVLAAILLFVAQAALIGLGFAVFGLINLLWSVGAFVAERIKRARGHVVEGLPKLLPGPMPVPKKDDRQRIEGQVRVPQPIDSPLGHRPCAAFRLVGEGPRGRVDDAGGTSFEVLTDGSVARVELGEATIDIEVSDPPQTVRPDRPLRRFLERRGIFPEKGAVRLAEGVIRDGDRVEIIGHAGQLSQTEGYRGTRSVQIFRDSSEAPLEIRLLP